MLLNKDLVMHKCPIQEGWGGWQGSYRGVAIQVLPHNDWLMLKNWRYKYKQHAIITFIPVTVQAPVVQKVDSTIEGINHYPEDNTKDCVNTYPLDSDLSSG